MYDVHIVLDTFGDYVNSQLNILRIYVHQVVCSEHHNKQSGKGHTERHNTFKFAAEWCLEMDLVIHKSILIEYVLSK